MNDACNSRTEAVCGMSDQRGYEGLTERDKDQEVVVLLMSWSKFGDNDVSRGGRYHGTVSLTY